ncbi:hypothetical protein Prudu_006341 [Prunus dulcis]|uniref:Uncharacterized protein n=1 Tax=Prunus dulcis TaxID=3755 RepID=A0A4Y1QZK2_PRUDU|nr:hypothetical protein Prudu_006341 [Prunus dulcis]
MSHRSRHRAHFAFERGARALRRQFQKSVNGNPSDFYASSRHTRRSPKCANGNQGESQAVYRQSKLPTTPKASMEMWLCVKRAISAAERAKRAYDDGRAKVAEAGKALQEHAQLLKEKEAAERQALASEAKAEQMRAALEAARAAARDAEAVSEAIQDALQESERTKAAEIEAAVHSAVQGYRSSDEFTTLLDKEVGSEMADLLYRFKRYNPGQKLNLNFAADPPPLPEGLTEEMIEDYEGEDAEAPGSAEANTVAGDEAAA